MAIWYHGSTTHLTCFSLAGGRSDGGNFLFLSQSPNVARRYGAAVVLLSGVNHQTLPQMTVTNWLNGNEPPATDFVITGETDSFDFPVDTLVLRSYPGEPFVPVSQPDLEKLDDGRACFEPSGPDDREWALFVEDICGGEDPMDKFGSLSP